jgi:hypothetical protein
MSKPNIPKANPKVVPPTIPQPRHRDDLGRNALVNLLENIDGAQIMKDAGKPQEEVIGYVETAIGEFKSTPGVSCDGGAIFFGITLGRITLDVTFSDPAGELSVTYMAKRRA